MGTRSGAEKVGMSWPKHIVVVGGGTAGWLAALMLGDVVKRAKASTRVTVIESSKLGTIGVGEGTTAVFRMMLKHFGFDELAFLRETGATIKYGIRHRDWRKVGHEYVGPIDDPHLVTGHADQGPFLDAYQISQGRHVGETHLFQHLIDRARAPFAMKGAKLVPVGPFHHAFHFDQALAGQFLRRQAKVVAVIDDQVQGLERDEDGNITALKLESGAEVQGDFFIDCSGFRRVLIKAMGAEWVSYRDVLPVNRAMPFWLDIPEGEEIDPVTLAWAQGAGWLWKIPTQERYGCGYVYSDLHLSPDQAQVEIEATLGHRIEPRNDIKIDAGRLDQVWIKNCVALGLSSSFLEPLEATSIHGSVVQLMLLAQLLERTDPRNIQSYNATVARQVDDFRDFIRLHYISERRDTKFWQDVAASTPQTTRDRVAHFANRIPSPRDFTPFPGNLPHVTHHLHTPVLDGLGLLSQQAAKGILAQNPKLRALGRKTAEQLTKEYRLAASQALPHRQFLQSLRQT
jgi:glycine/D-amino acid oxidase-like deaminating enzyme